VRKAVFITSNSRLKDTENLIFYFFSHDIIFNAAIYKKVVILAAFMKVASLLLTT
jgi:hypothetical protein